MQRGSSSIPAIRDARRWAVLLSAAVVACLVIAVSLPGRVLAAESGLAQGSVDGLSAQAAQLARGRNAAISGTLVRKEVHMNVDAGAEGTNVVYYVVELDEPAVLDELGDSFDVASVQVGRVMSGARTQQPLASFSEMGDSQLEPLVGKAVDASGTFAVYGGTFMWTQYQLSDATVQASPDPDREIAMYRLYNPYSGEHFYTSDASERDFVASAGWVDEGTGWTAPPAGDPVYRLYNPYAGEHHYTLDASERDGLAAAGWTDEGVGWYSDPDGAVPLYREYNPNMYSCNHNYTTDKDEHDNLVSLGWLDEGIAWYGI